MVTPAVNSRAKPSLFPLALISLDTFVDLFSNWGSDVPRGVMGYRPLSTAIAALSGGNDVCCPETPTWGSLSWGQGRYVVYVVVNSCRNGEAAGSFAMSRTCNPLHMRASQCFLDLLASASG